MQGALQTLFGKNQPFYDKTTIYSLDSCNYKWILKGGETPIISSLHQYLGEQAWAMKLISLPEKLQNADAQIPQFEPCTTARCPPVFAALIDKAVCSPELFPTGPALRRLDTQSSQLESSSTTDFIIGAVIKNPKPAGASKLGSLNLELNSKLSIKTVLSRQDTRTKMDDIQGKMSQITPFMYVSGLQPARSSDMLRDNKITHVINFCGDSDSRNPLHLPESVYNFDDDASSQLEQVMFECFQVIDDVRR